MRGLASLIALFLILMTSGCISDTGNAVINFTDANATEPETGNSLSGITENDADDSGKEKKDVDSGREEHASADHDPCAGKICDDSITTCGDDIVTCENTCDPDTGMCSSCIPECPEPEPDECDKECGVCQELDEENCICVTELFCEGNGICTSDEWPDGEDCLEFNGCDDNDDCTQDTFDPNQQACIHDDICCETGDECMMGEYNYDTGKCDYTYICCGNGFCDEDDKDYCPEECDYNGGSGDVAIEDIDPTGNETVTLSGIGVDMTNWTIEDEGSHLYTFPNGFDIDGIVYLHTRGCPENNNETDLYWESDGTCYGSFIWNDGGDTATLRDSFGEIVDTYSY
jgi:hypothetical protein